MQTSNVDAAWYGTLTRVLAGGFSLGPFNIPPIPTPSQQVSEDRTGSREEVYITEGVFEEVSEFKDWEGINATLGVLVHLSRALTIGAVADLPWTARANQTKTVRNRATTRLGSSSRVVDEFFSEQVTSKDIEFEFPMYWAVGMVWRWTQLFYTTLDFSQTLWSDFSFKAEGETRINPVNGRPHREAPLEDAMSIRAGLEKLFLTRKREIPLRAGFAWEERPSIKGVDDYYSVGLGSGLSIGRDPGRLFLDFAYLYTFARKVRGFVPDQAGFATDVSEHQGYLSVIKHF